MGYMKELYTELQEAGWEKEEIESIPNEFAWEMAGNKKLKEKVKELKEEGFLLKPPKNKRS